MKTSILLFCAAFILQACNTPDKQTHTADSVKTVVKDETQADTVPTIFKGLYTFGNEINTFRHCGSPEKVYWVNDSLASLRDHYEKTHRFPSYPYESVYAEVKGYLAGKSKLGYASGYENVLIVTDIIKVEAKNFRTECYNYEFIILGNEPFWSVDIIPGEQRIVLKDVGVEKVHEFIYSPALIKEGVHRYEATNPANDKLIVLIREEKCSDGMSDRQYNYSAEVNFNGKIYKGCAIKKGDSFPDRP
ncbi:hypothetical protein [Daejeonella sp. JGW-45]|uniref:COG3650 family protein n=1 Tax=Daejeonella sp. JGW-45 TaxID=3034148 RepID=UPI0023EABD52|nr:hypothetical protein [Daejeonella sp. JGW-45]